MQGEINNASQPKIRNFNVHFFTYQDVLRFQIPMKYPFSMHILHSQKYLVEQLLLQSPIYFSQLLFHSALRLLDDFGQVVSDEFEHQFYSWVVGFKQNCLVEEPTSDKMHLTMCWWLRVWRMDNQRRVVLDTPSSARSIFMHLIATIVLFALSTHSYTLPYAPSPSSPFFSYRTSYCIILHRSFPYPSLHSIYYPSLQILYNNIYHTSAMKDRWKILIASISVGVVITLIATFFGLSLKSVGLRSYGILQYTYFHTVGDQTTRANGNYLVGIDYAFITYPRGLLKHQFQIDILTSDRSQIRVEGLLLSKLRSSSTVNLYSSYGPDAYRTVLNAAAEELFRESLQIFTLGQLISDRKQVAQYVTAFTCVALQNLYPWVLCQSITMGGIITHIQSVLVPPLDRVKNYVSKVIRLAIASERKNNVLEAGGRKLLQDIDKANALLFLNITKSILETIGSAVTVNKDKEIFAGAIYALSNPYLPILSNVVGFNLSYLQ